VYRDHQVVRGLEFPVLKGLDLEVPDGAVVTVLGESGSGKTTLLRMIAGFDRPDAGTIVIDGQVVDSADRFVPPERRRIGYVAQEGDLYVGAYSPKHRVAVFLPAPNRLTVSVPIDRSEWFRRFLSLPAGARLVEPHLLTFTFAHSFGPATLYCFAVLVEPRRTPGRVLAADVVRIEVRLPTEAAHRP